MAESDVIVRFKELFDGNEVGFYKHAKSRGEWHNWAADGEITEADVRKHLMGREGIAVIPIKQNNTCLFAVIDCDWHKKTKEDVDIGLLAEYISEKELPLVPCRSKSGGAHLYCFFTEPIAAALAVRLMQRLAKKLGISSEFEIFPKQTKLMRGQRGNGISLPYFGGDKTQRYAVEKKTTGISKLSVEEFIALCESSAINQKQVMELLHDEHSEAPPCLQRIIEDGVGSGSRNEALYNLTIYMKKRFPDDYMDRLLDLNMEIFDKPLSSREARATISSASRRDYKYRCSESPCRDLCNREECVKRKFGIDEEDIEYASIGDIFSSLKRFDTDPVQWEICIKGHRIIVKTPTLMDYRKLMEAALEAASIVLPLMKNAEWLRLLSQLMANVEYVEAPKEAKASGMLMVKLSEYIRRAHIVSAEDGSAGRTAIMHGAPIVDVDPSGRMKAYFKGASFIDFLKRSRQGTVSPSSVWMTVKEHGVVSDRIRVGKKVVAVWAIDVDQDEYQNFVPKFKQEF